MDKAKHYLVAGFFAAILSGCASHPPILNLEDELLPIPAGGSTYTKEEVQQAILTACNRRGWAAQGREEGLIEASILVRRHRARIEIRYDETKISILYKDSDNLDYRKGTIHRNYNHWIATLYRTILRQLGSRSQYY
jgi:hypothetical protein